MIVPSENLRTNLRPCVRLDEKREKRQSKRKMRRLNETNVFIPDCIIYTSTTGLHKRGNGAMASTFGKWKAKPRPGRMASLPTAGLQ